MAKSERPYSPLKASDGKVKTGRRTTDVLHRWNRQKVLEDAWTQGLARTDRKNRKTQVQTNKQIDRRADEWTEGRIAQRLSGFMEDKHILTFIWMTLIIQLLQSVRAIEFARKTHALVLFHRDCRSYLNYSFIDSQLFFSLLSIGVVSFPVLLNTPQRSEYAAKRV